MAHPAPMPLENCMESLILLFHNYANEDSDGTTLSKRELKKLIEVELPSLYKAQKDPKFVDKLMKDLDQNKDEKLDFEEFIPFITGLSLNCERLYQLHQNKGKKK